MARSPSPEKHEPPACIAVLDLEVSPDPIAAMLLNARTPTRGSSWATSRIDVATVLVARRRGKKWKVDHFVTYDADPASPHSNCDEKGLLIEIARLLQEAGTGATAERQPRLVTYNGETFDLPILRRRALYHGLFDETDLLEPTGLRSFDVMRRLALPWGTKAPKLKEAAAGLRVPATHIVPRGRRFLKGERAAKCEVDVCATYLLHAFEMAAECGDGTIVDAQWRGLADEIGYDRFVPGHLAQFARHPRMRGEADTDAWMREAMRGSEDAG